MSKKEEEPRKKASSRSNNMRRFARELKALRYRRKHKPRVNTSTKIPDTVTVVYSPISPVVEEVKREDLEEVLQSYAQKQGISARQLLRDNMVVVVGGSCLVPDPPKEEVLFENGNR